MEKDNRNLKSNHKNNGFKTRISAGLGKCFGFLTKFGETVWSCSDLRKRVISAAVLLPIAIYALYFSKTLFFFLVVAVAILETYEWLELTKFSAEQRKWHIVGFFYILIPIWAVLVLRDADPSIILWMFFIIWTTDIFAYFAGKTLGGAKLAPEISPNKTWSGLIGGVVASMVIGFLSSFIFVSGNIFFFVSVSGLLAVIEQCSDLVESKLKRIFGVKDTSNLIPGHGGILDRLDGLMLVAPMVLLLFWIYPEKFIAMSQVVVN